MLRPSSADDADALAKATLALGVIRGLMLDENAAREPGRVDTAVAAFQSLE